MQERPQPPRLRHLFALLALLAPMGCDSATSPVAPSDTILSLTANPPAIGIEGSSSITATALRPDGGPAREGTEITFSTTLGQIAPASGRTDANGRAAATLTADGRSGSARVRATSGTRSAEATVSIQANRPSAGFSTQIDGLTVIFSDSSSGNPISWAWDFGDGNSSQEQNPVHTYAVADTYVVQLTATNAVGSDTVSQFVTVQ